MTYKFKIGDWVLLVRNKGKGSIKIIAFATVPFSKDEIPRYLCEWETDGRKRKAVYKETSLSVAEELKA
jgi:hypothetical protein